MNDTFLNIWLIFGLSCILAEFLIPGLVLVFVGLGALTTYLMVSLGIIDTFIYQVICFLLSSIVYLLALRTILLSFLPTNTKVSNTNEDEVELGEIVVVEQDILGSSLGRIQYQDTTWSAKSLNNTDILKGEEAKIVGRENITYIVEKGK